MQTATAPDAVGARAGDVPRRVADQDRLVSRVGGASRTLEPAGPAPRDRWQHRPVLGVGAEAALAGRESVSEAGRFSFSRATGSKLPVTSESRRLSWGICRRGAGQTRAVATWLLAGEPVQQLRHPVDDGVREIGRAQLGIEPAALVPHVIGELIDPLRRDARVEQDDPRDLTVGAAVPRRCSV